MSILLAEPLGWIRSHLPRLRISLFVLNAPEAGGGGGGGGDEGDEWARAMRSAAAEAHDLSGASDAAAAATINAARVHLLVNLDALQPQPQPSPSLSPSHSPYGVNTHPKQVDLNGLYSRGARPLLLAARPAPLQAAHPTTNPEPQPAPRPAPQPEAQHAPQPSLHPNQAAHLGYGASTGARFIDYAIADRLAAPPLRASTRWYTEKLLLLPPSHLPSGHATLFPHLRDATPRACCAAAATTSGVGPGEHAASGGDEPDEPSSNAAARTRCRREGRARFGLPPPPSRALARRQRGGVVFVYFGQHLKLDELTFERWALAPAHHPRPPPSPLTPALTHQVDGHPTPQPALRPVACRVARLTLAAARGGGGGGGGAVASRLQRAHCAGQR